MTTENEGRASEEIAEILDGCLRGLDEEIEAVRLDLARRGLESPVTGAAGRLLDSAGPGFRYEWTLPRDPLDIRPDDGVLVRTPAGESRGVVLGYRRAGSSVRVSVMDWLGRSPGMAELEFDPTWLLAALAERLSGIREQPARYCVETVLRLFGRTYPRLGSTPTRRPESAELNPVQRSALERVLGSQTHFVWGPPGTGKTRLLGHAVAELAARGRVLVAATTNGALDEAAGRVVDALGRSAVEANRVIRIGAEFSLTGDPALSLGAALERRIASGAGGVERLLGELESRLRGSRPAAGGHASGASGPGRKASRRGTGPMDVRARYARLSAAVRAAGDSEARSRLARLGGEIQKQSILALKSADIVLSTLARLAVSDELSALRFDSLVLDEASTAPLPYVALAASLTRGRTVAIGDFQQLPAVVLSSEEEANRWLRRDIFREAGVIGDARPGEVSLPGEHDALCAMLVEQYRMAPLIRSLVSDLFYGGRLRDADEVAQRAALREPLVLLDTTGLRPVVERSEGSRSNPVHAEAIVEFLQLAAAAGRQDVAVVVPYRLQARRLRSLVRERLGRVAPRHLEISTIHRFQGREKSVVVFDTVDSPPGRSWFLHEGRNPDFPRLLNVALSRTRDMLVVVGTGEGLERTLPPGALLLRVLERLRASGVVLEARSLRARGPRLFQRVEGEPEGGCGQAPPRPSVQSASLPGKEARET
ncbi:MAG: DEAD/DEAH box helicase [Gemmatimonadota bacterium]